MFDDLLTPSEVAETQLGVSEATGSNDGVPAERYMRGDKLAWCAGFIMWCFDQSDFPSLYETARGYYDLRNVQQFEDEMKRRGCWYGGQLADWVWPNDIIFYGDRQGSDRGRGRHVGLVVEVGTDDEGLYMHTIEGNYADKVSARVVRADSRAITGFGRWHPGMMA